MGYGYVLNSMGQSQEIAIDMSQLTESLQDVWESLEIYSPDSGSYLIRFQGTINNKTVLGGLQEDKQTITVESSSLLTVAKIALWYRTVFPSEHNLFLYKGTTIDSPIEVIQSLTPNEIVQLLEQADLD